MRSARVNPHEDAVDLDRTARRGGDPHRGARRIGLAAVFAITARDRGEITQIGEEDGHPGPAGPGSRRPRRRPPLEVLGRHRRAWTVMSPSTNCMVAGSSGIWPDRYTAPPAATACEYGPDGLGARSVAMMRRDMAAPGERGRAAEGKQSAAAWATADARPDDRVHPCTTARRRTRRITSARCLRLRTSMVKTM